MFFSFCYVIISIDYYYLYHDSDKNIKFNKLLMINYKFVRNANIQHSLLSS